MNRPIHFEIHSPDPDKARTFYEAIFGWKFSRWEGPEEYWLITTGELGEGINGGMLRSRDGQPRTVNTLEVSSVDEFAKLVVANGGRVVVPKMAIAGVGWLVFCTDPGGVIFGITHRDPRAH